MLEWILERKRYFIIAA